MDALEVPEINEEDNEYEKEVVLYRKNRDYLGQKKTISLTYDTAMQVEVFKEE